METTVPILRVARPTDDLERLLPFYRDGLGLGVLFRFADHDGFDGVTWRKVVEGRAAFAPCVGVA